MQRGFHCTKVLKHVRLPLLKVVLWCILSYCVQHHAQGAELLVCLPRSALGCPTLRASLSCAQLNAQEAVIADLLDEMAEQRLKEELLAYVLLLMHGEPFVDMCPGGLCPWPKSCTSCWSRFTVSYPCTARLTCHWHPASDMVNPSRDAAG